MNLQFSGENGHDGRDGTAGKNGRDGQKIYETEINRETGERKNVLVQTEPGGNGENGYPGLNGSDGTHGQDVSFELKRTGKGFSISSKTEMKTFEELLTINTSGGNGGRGGHGGKGGSAGSGNPPGIPGIYGTGGKGGDGGNAGSITISTDDPQILPIVKMIAKGGESGIGGNGANYEQEHGRNGADGVKTFIANYEGKEYRDSIVGIEQSRILLDHNPDENNGNYRAGNQLDVLKLDFKNPSNIPMPSPFTIKMVSDVDWVKTEGSLKVNEGVVEPKSNIIYDCDFKINISDDVQVGYMKLQAVPLFEHNGKEYRLIDPNRGPFTFNYSVNFRFTLEQKNYNNISEENWIKLLNYLESLNPHQQYTACVGMLLQPILSDKREFDDDTRAEEHYEQIFEGLAGEFFEHKEFNKLLDNEYFQSIPVDYPDFAFDAAIDFLQHFDESCHKKIMDAIVFSGTMGDEIKEEHKIYIRKFADAIFEDSAWVKKNYALVYKKGNRKVAATSTNSVVNLILTLPVFLLFSIQAYAEYGIGSVFQAALFDLKGFFELWSRLHYIIIPVYFFGLTWLMRKLFYVKSCPRCMSVKLDPISKEDSSYGDDITHRCLDCGARSSSNRNSKNEQLFIRSRNAIGKKHYLERIPGSRYILYAINILQILINPMLWLSLASMTFVGRFDKQESFRKGLIRSIVGIAGFAVVAELLRSIIVG